jgi:hypothetical protein
LLSIYSQNQSENLQASVLKGPTSALQLYDQLLISSIHEKEQNKRNIENIYDSAKSNYKKNIIEPWESDKFFGMEKNLWIYFLTDPLKVLECIKEVQKKASQVGTSSFNALNINFSIHKK